MKSIRLSLMVYFLGLVALGLGAASWFVYETARQALDDKQRTTRKTLQDKHHTTQELIETQYKERCRAEETRLDEQLLLEAQTFSTLVRFKMDKMVRGRELNLLNIAGLVASQASPDLRAAPFVAPTPGLWAGSVGNGGRGDWAALPYRRYYEEYSRRRPAIQFNEDELTHETENRIAHYFQISIDDDRSALPAEAGRTRYRSFSLYDIDDSLPLDKSRFEKDRLPAWKWDEVKLTTGVTVRRVVLKTPSVYYQFYGPRSGRPSPPPIPPTPAPPDPPQRPPLYIHCAYDVAERDKTLAGYADRRDQELASFVKRLDEELTALDAETTESLRKVRIRLLLVGCATFGLTVVGTWFFVWLGLRPLQRVSEAVSRVTERDFRLQINETALPSELRPIVERLTDTLIQLQQAFAREKQATADISHELRTPVAALLTTTDLALRKPRSAEEYREMLEECRMNGQQMNHAVERLLALARLDAGVATLRPERVDVVELAAQCAAVVRPLAEARGLNLRVHGSDGAQLIADPDKLREIITNLLHNAIEYNRPQGSIDVDVARENGHLHVAVRDTGVGIAANDQEHIFERFYRADSARSGDGMHTGLGLAIVKGYVDLMGGTIRVESTQGEGSTFHLELPVERPRSLSRSSGEIDVSRVPFSA